MPSDNNADSSCSCGALSPSSGELWEKLPFLAECAVERGGLDETAADLARFAVGPPGVPVGGLPAGQAVQGVAGSGFEQGLVGALLLGARGQARDQLTHLLQVTWDQNQKTSSRQERSFEAVAERRTLNSL